MSEAGQRRFLATAAAFGLCAALVPARQALAADDAAALLAKHQAYVGWHVGDGQVQTLRAEGTMTYPKKPATKVVILRYGIAYRERSFDDHGLEDDQGFTGTTSWLAGPNGFTIRPVGEVARYLFDRDALFGERTGELTPQLLRHEQVAGGDTVVLRLTSAVGFPIDVYVDPSTGAYKRIVIDPDGKYEEIYNGLAYTEVGGRHFLSAYYLYDDSKSVIRFDKIDVNVPVTPAELHPPKQTATWTFGEGTAAVELTKGVVAPRIFIDLVMNGVKGKFLLDTGAEGTAVVDSFARQIGAKRLTRSEISGIGGTVDANVFQVDTVAVGPSVLHNLIVTSGLQEEWQSEGGVAGIVGFDLLAGAIVDLDFDAKTLRVLDPEKVEPDKSQGIVLRVDLSDGHIRVPMKLNDKYDVIATLDSGNSAQVAFSQDLIDRNHLLFRSAGTMYFSGVGNGYQAERCGYLSSLQLGPIVYKPVAACASDFETRNEILVGLDFMKAFNYVFDYPDGIVVMIPRKP